MGWGEGSPLEGPEGLPSGLFAIYSNNTEATDPGTGKVKFDKTKLSEITKLRISEIDADGESTVGFLTFLEKDFTEHPTNKGALLISNEEQTAFLLCSIESVTTDSGSWRTVTVTPLVMNGTFTNGERLLLEFFTSGIKDESITTPMLKAGAVTAAKISVEKLSAIVANLGTVTAGLLEAVHIKAAEIDFPYSSSKLATNTLRWLSGETEKGSITTFNPFSGKNPYLDIESNGSKQDTLLRIIGRDKGLGPGEEAITARIASIVGGIKKVFLDEEDKSEFIQLVALSKIKVTLGVVSAAGGVLHEGTGGWSVKKVEKGVYDITLTTAATQPIPFAIDIQAGQRTASTTALSTTKVRVVMSNWNAEKEDIAFGFAVFGVN
jgi:hypothetical protein